MQKPHINVVFVGHVDHGKSTLVGRLLYDSGRIREDEMKKLKEVAREVGKETFEFAFVMDTLKEERERGVTIDINWKELETQHNKITIIDAPGHKDFIKNMITGASDADAAVLVVDTAIGIQPQTKEHLFLVKTLGVDQLIVAANKMDKVDYSKATFENIRAQILKLTNLAGYSNVLFLPVSAYQGDNVVNKSAKLSWYNGPTLAMALDQLKSPERPTEKPLRLPVDKVYSIKGVGTVPIGRVETGVLKVGSSVVFMPANVTGEVKSIEMHHQQLTQAEPGDNVGFNVRGADHKLIKRGDVCGTQDSPPSVVTPNDVMECKIVVLEHPTGVKAGNVVSIFVHTADAPGRVVEIVNRIDSASGQVIEANPKLLRTGEAGIIRIQPFQPVAIEKASVIPQLSRFAMREGGQTIAAGVCVDVKRGS